MHCVVTAAVILLAIASFGSREGVARPLKRTSRHLMQIASVSFPGGSVNQNGGNVQVQFPGGSTQVAVSPSPSPNPSNETSPSPSPVPATVGVTAPGTTVDVNAGRKLQRIDVSYPGGSVGVNGGNVRVNYPGGSVDRRGGNVRVRFPFGSFSRDGRGSTRTSVPGYADVSTQGPGRVRVSAPKTSVNVDAGDGK